MLTLAAIREKLGVLGIEELNDFARLLRGGDAGKVFEQLDRVLAAGVSIEQFVQDLAEYFRSLLFIKSGIGRDTILGYSTEDFDRIVLDSLSSSQIEKAIEILLSVYKNVRFSLNQRFELELALARLVELDQLITPLEVKQALSQIKGEMLAGTGVRLASVPAEATPTAPPVEAAGGSAAQIDVVHDASEVAAKLIEGFRREKPSVASWLEKAAAVVLDRNEFHLTYLARDRFAGEQLLRERETLAERASHIVGHAVKVRVSFQEQSSESGSPDPRVELVKRVFRGDVVKGEDHGGKPV